MCQQDLAILPMGQLVPVDGIFTPGAQVKAEVVVHVKHVHFVEVCHSRAVEISLYDIPAQVVLCVLVKKEVSKFRCKTWERKKQKQKQPQVYHSNLVQK